MAAYWGEFLWGLTKGQNAAAAQTVVAIVQAFFTLLALAIAIYVPFRQQKQIQEADAKRRSEEVANLRHALREEVYLVTNQSFWAFERLTADPPEPLDITLPSLNVFKNSAYQIGLLGRSEVLSLLGFCAELDDLRRLRRSLSRTSKLGSVDRSNATIRLAAIGNLGAIFLKSLPKLPEGMEHRYKEHIEKMQRPSKQLGIPTIR